MTYIKTRWIEESMSVDQKIAGLNNLEIMYSEITTYITNYTHSSSYYNKTYCNSTYFTTSKDGAGSGLICKTLDGYTADQIIALGVASGSIVMWPNSIATIPTGFVLCNGANGTPDLRDKFVICTGSNYPQGGSGGSNTITVSSSALTIAGHALTDLEMPYHNHSGIQDYFPRGDGANGPGGGTTYVGYILGCVSHVVYTGYSGYGELHSHNATFTGTANQNKMPPYVALCYIMRT